MPEYLRPGVFIEEIERGPRRSKGVPDQHCRLPGEAERGPNQAAPGHQLQRYKRWFGGDVFGAARDRFLPMGPAALRERRRRLFVCRIVGPGRIMANKTFGDFVVAGVGAASGAIASMSSSPTARSDDRRQHAPGPRRLSVKGRYWSSVPQVSRRSIPSIRPNRAQFSRPTRTEDFDDLASTSNPPDFYEKRMTDN